MDLTNTPLFGVPMSQPVAAPQPAAPVAPAPVPAQRYEEKDGKHRGVAGVARDVLGTLGDFLLTKLGVGPMYGPAQQRRKLAAAQEGFDADPLSAINRVTSVDPVMGAKLREQYIDNQRIAAQNAATNEDRDTRLGLAEQAADQRTRGYAASMLGSMTGWDDKKRQEFYPKMRQQILTAGSRQGLDLSTELPESYDSVALDAFIDGSVPMGTQRAQKLTAERNDIMRAQGSQRIEVAETNAETAQANAGTRARQAGRKRPVGRYVDDQGYNVVQYDDGSEQRGSRKVQPRPARAGAAPKVKGTPPKAGEIRVLPNGVKVRIK